MEEIEQKEQQKKEAIEENNKFFQKDGKRHVKRDYEGKKDSSRVNDKSVRGFKFLKSN